jgi:hypothetical protein
VTVPSPAYRAGNFNSAMAVFSSTPPLGTDPVGRPILANQIYDPNTARLVGGQLVTDPFPGNVIPSNRLDPVALRIQNQIPLPTLPGLFNNYLPTYPSTRHTTIPSVKADQILGAKSKISFYWSFTHTDSAFSPIYGQSEGYPNTITEDRGTFIHSHVERLNYDNTLSPTLLLHLGAGYQQNNFFDDAPILNFNAATMYGLTGTTVNRNVPVFTGFCPSFGPAIPTCGPAGGMENMGPYAGQTHTFFEKPSADASMTWVKGNHTFKAGAEMFLIGVPTYPYTNTGGTFGIPQREVAMGCVSSGLVEGEAESDADLRSAVGLRHVCKRRVRAGGRFLSDDAESECRRRAGRLALPTDMPLQLRQQLSIRAGAAGGGGVQITPKTVLRAGWGLSRANEPDHGRNPGDEHGEFAESRGGRDDSGEWHSGQYDPEVAEFQPWTCAVTARQRCHEPSGMPGVAGPEFGAAGTAEPMEHQYPAGVQRESGIGGRIRGESRSMVAGTRAAKSQRHHTSDSGGARA